MASIRSGKPLIREPPPVMMMPFCAISPKSSGGVRSKTLCTPSMMVVAHSSKASMTSSVVMVKTRGSPVIRQRPFTSTEAFSSKGYRQPISILIFSAVRSPMRILNFLRQYFVSASSNLSPAVLIDSLTTTPPSEITAISVVPPPISTTILPSGISILMPAPSAAAIGSSTR